MSKIRKFEEFINEYYETDIHGIPDGILNHWLYHYDLWCKENGQKPEYDGVEELKDDQSAIDHVYYHADLYAKKHGFKLDGWEYMENDEIEESLLEGKVSDVEHIGHGLKYHNEHFPGGFNSPKRYEGKGKHKWRVLAKEGEKIKVINFGKRDDIKKEDLTRLSKKYWEHFWRHE